MFACAGALLAALTAPAAAATNGQLALVADERLVTVNTDGTGQLTPALGDQQKVSEVAWSPDGNRLALVNSGRVEVYDPPTGRVAGKRTGVLQRCGRNDRKRWIAVPNLTRQAMTRRRGDTLTLTTVEQ